MRIRSQPGSLLMERRMGDFGLQILISAVNKDVSLMPKRMNLESDAVIVNQLIGEKAPIGDDSQELNGDVAYGAAMEKDSSFSYEEHEVRVITRREKGVGLSRNTALEAADKEIIQFGDDDIVYSRGYADKILSEFEKHPEADVLLFNVKQQPGRETYHNTDYKQISWYNYGRYPAYAICARRQKIIDSGVRYSLLFGGGAPYMNGEDSLFLHDCLKAGLKLYRTPVKIGEEQPGESTWFKGYTDKFFFDRGVLYHFLYGKAAALWGFRFLFKNRNEMCRKKGFAVCYRLLLNGVRHGRTL